MDFYGWQKLTLLDFPGKTACTLFTAGCELRCPFCHNADLAFGNPGAPISEPVLFSFLEKRRGLLDGVAITGGEPLLQPELFPFLERVRAMGYSVKLDTNGCHPGPLREAAERGLVQYVAMDIKSAPESYGRVCGRPGMDLEPIRRSIAFLLEGSVDYEFRTTLVRGLHRPEDVIGAARMIEGAERYFLQAFSDPGHLSHTGFSAFSRAEMEQMLEQARPFVKHIALRGL